MNIEREVHILNIDDVLPNRFQPRIVFDEKAINELTESIKEHGVIQPIVVRKVADKFEIIAGERRYKASVLAGKTTIPAIVADLDDKSSAEVALIENVQRQNLTPIEEAVSYKKILDMGYLNQNDLANKLGKTQSTIANKLRLLNLSDKVQEALLEERISERHARSLLRLTEEAQDKMLDRIIQERMTVRKTDEEINKLLNGTTEPVEKTIQPVASPENKGNEDPKMNQENNTNPFNIPNSPIMDSATTQPIMPQSEPFVQQPVAPVEPTVNPMSFVSPFENNITVAPVQQTPVQPEPIVQPVAEPVAPVQPIIFDTPVASVETAPVEQVMPQTLENEPASEQNVDTPITGRFFNMFSEEPQEEVSQVAESVAPVPPAVEPVIQPVQPVVDPTAVSATFNFNPFENQPVQPAVEPVIQTQPVAQPVEPIPMPTVETPAPNQFAEPTIQQVQTFKLNDNQEFQNSSVVEMGSFGTKMEEPTLEPLMDVEEKGPKVDMRQIIQMIRDCSNQIEKYGYTIDTDELDFEDSYQVIFKIDKPED